MITIKVPYKTSEENIKVIQNLRREFSNVVRFAYNRANEGTKQIVIREKLKELNNIADLSSWLSQCAILNALALKKRNKDKKVIFGGAKTMKLRCLGKITHEEFKERRLLHLAIQGEKGYKGNRAFDFSE